MIPGVCLLDGCTRGGKLRRGLCGAHYQYLKKHDQLDQFASKLIHATATLDERLRHHGWTVTPSGCWEWKAYRNPKGYGMLAAGIGRPVLATRAAYVAWIGELEDGEVVCHTCDNPPCINPAHLFTGTRVDNNEDMRLKLRVANGERSGVHKLKDQDVERLRAMYASGRHSQKEVAEVFGVSDALVSMIVNYRRRARVTNPPLLRR
jgi:hypothetical protein